MVAGGCRALQVPEWESKLREHGGGSKSIHMQNYFKYKYVYNMFIYENWITFKPLKMVWMHTNAGECWALINLKIFFLGLWFGLVPYLDLSQTSTCLWLALVSDLDMSQTWICLRPGLVSHFSVSVSLWSCSWLKNCYAVASYHMHTFWQDIIPYSG